MLERLTSTVIDYPPWVERWEAVEPRLVTLHRTKARSRDTGIIGSLIHDGNKAKIKMVLALAPDYNAEVRRQVWIPFSWLVAFAEHILAYEDRIEALHLERTTDDLAAKQLNAGLVARVGALEALVARGAELIRKITPSGQRNAWLDDASSSLAARAGRKAVT